jgi:SpoVK/Ycf46/Vps4 family AAA+-type ATPase
MTFIKEFNLLLKARYSLLYISTLEEDRLEYSIRKALELINLKSIYIWDFIDGYSPNLNKTKFAIKNPFQALEFVENFTTDIPTIFILKDFNKFLSDILISRKIKNLFRLLKIQQKTIIILSNEVNIPNELLTYFNIIEFLLPNKKEIYTEVMKLSDSLNKKLDSNFLDLLAHACKGLSIEQIRYILSKSIAKYSLIDEKILDLIFIEKCQIIKRTQILEFQISDIRFSDIAGLENLKKWLIMRKNALNQKAHLYGLTFPRGVLLTGIQGTGKSLTAKSIAYEWNLPLLKLDIGRIFGGVVGESENKLRQMIQLTDALQPCILWIDEIDKAFAENSQTSDSGTTKRVLATFITWLSEKKTNVFIVGTANNFLAMPIELIRKGRFDEIFFLGLPNDIERKKIFQLFLTRFRPKIINTFNFDNFVEKSVGFSGAEIEQAIIEAMYIGFNEKREFNNQDILFTLNQIIPLSIIDTKRIKEIEALALAGRIRLASDL